MNTLGLHCFVSGHPKGQKSMRDQVNGEMFYVEIWLLSSSDKSFLSIPCGGGLWPRHASLEGCCLPKVTFESMLGLRCLPRYEESLHCGPAAPPKIWLFISKTFVLVILCLPRRRPPLKIKVRKLSPLLQVLAFLKITSIKSINVYFR